MQIDYKRDLNHTYVILQEEKEPDTASYQIRMLLTNAIPGHFGLQNRAKWMIKHCFYYEVTFGSVSTSRTFLPSIASPMPRFSQVVHFFPHRHF